MPARILALEEDNARTAELKESLEEPGHHLIHFSSMYRAIEYLSNNDVDLAICDLHLQNGCSFDFLREVKANPKTKSLSLLFYCIEPSHLTRSFRKGILAAAKRLGAVDVIYMEQFNPQELCEQVEKHLPEIVERQCA